MTSLFFVSVTMEINIYIKTIQKLGVGKIPKACFTVTLYMFLLSLL